MNPPGFYIPLYEGLLDKKHIEAFGPTPLWLYLWLLKKTTSESNRIGFVLGSAYGHQPITDALLAAELYQHPNTIRRWRKKLVRGGYIIAKRVPNGFVYAVTNSKKFIGRRVPGRAARPGFSHQGFTRSGQTDRPEMVNRRDQYWSKQDRQDRTKQEQENETFWERAQQLRRVVGSSK